MPTEQQNLSVFLADPLRQIVVRLGKNTISDMADPPGIDGFQECTFPGYAAVVVDPDAWSMDGENVAELAQAVAKVHFESSNLVTVPELVTCFAVEHVYNDGTPIFLRSWWAQPTYLIDGPQELDFDVRFISADLPSA